MIRIPNDALPFVESCLTKAPTRSTLEVADVTACGEDAQRLEVLGICGGRSIEVLRAGDPLIVRVVGSRLGISRRLADKVVVRHN